MHEARGVVHFWGDAINAGAVKQIDFILKIEQSWGSST